MDFFTSDLHFGSSNIIKYCDRPFKSVEHMNKRLINEINQKCHSDTDVIFHLGDFVLYGRERGIESSRVKPIEFEKLIKPKIIHILGNHDLNNGVKGSLLSAYVKIGQKTAWIQHYPPWYDEYKAPVDDKINLYLCSHVHEKCKFRTYNNKLCINVGVDVNNYRPLSVKDIVKYYDKFIKGILNINE